MTANTTSSAITLSHTLYEPLLPPLVAVISGLLFYKALGYELVPASLLALLFVALFALGRILSFRWVSFVSGNLVMFWLAVASSSYQYDRPKPLIEAEPREVVYLEGCVDSLPQREADRFTFQFAADPQARLRVALYLKPEEPSPTFAYGQRYNLPLRIRPVHNAGNPGNFDAEAYMAHREIYWSASISKSHVAVPLEGQCGSAMRGATLKLRAFLLDRIHKLAQTDTYLEAMLGALLLGDNAKLEQSWTDNYRKTGTYHAIVISGLHITVLAGALFALLRLCRVRPMPAYCACAVLAIVYALVCDLSAPVVRAAGGYLLFLLARFFHRRTRIVNLVAAAAIAYLLVDPAQLFEASFQLSFLSVLALGTLASPLADATTANWKAATYHLEEARVDFHLTPAAQEIRLELRLLAETVSLWFPVSLVTAQRAVEKVLFVVVWCADLFLSSGVILVGLCLPMVLFFHRLTFASLTANIPVVFLLSAAVPLGFLAILTGPVMAPLLRLILVLSRNVVDWHLSWDSSARVPDPPVWLLLALPASLVLTAFACRHKFRYTWASVALSVGLFLTLVFHPFSGSPRLHGPLFEVTSVDVGQGDSFFFATPSGHLALLDAGGSRSPRFDTGEDLVSPYLWSRQIAKIDTIIASHGDMDHMGGLLAVLDNFHPRELWVSSQVAGDLWKRLEAKAKLQGTKVRMLSRGDQLMMGEIPVRVLWPPADEPMRKSNLTSLVLLVEHGSKRFLFTGDIDKTVEARLAQDPTVGHVDVLKLAHHGSRTANSADFLQQTRPAIALVNAGFANTFNHPHPDTVGRLNELHAVVFRTDRMGQTTVLSDGRRLFTDTWVYRPRGVFSFSNLTLEAE